MDYSQLRKAAKKATPGPWIVDPKDISIVLAPCPCCGPVAQCFVFGPPGTKSPECYNTGYIAAANPSTIRSLLRDLDVANRGLEMSVELQRGKGPFYTVEYLLSTASREIGEKG